MCTHSGTSVTHPGGDPCATTCSGCQWTLTQITSKKVGTDCEFSYRVSRTGCDNQTNQTFSGTTVVPCNQSTTVNFYCDPQGTCVGYVLTLTGCPCPDPPGGGASPQTPERLT